MVIELKWLDAQRNFAEAQIVAQEIVHYFAWVDIYRIARSMAGAKRAACSANTEQLGTDE